MAPPNETHLHPLPRSGSHPRVQRVVLATFGTYGDLHPFIAVARALRERGIAATIAAARMYQPKIEAEGIAFQPLRPDMDVVGARLRMEQHEIARAVARRPEFIIEQILLPHLRETYEDALAAMRDADLVVTHSAAYGARLAADVLRLPHVSIVLQPMLLMSAYDPPIVGHMPRLSRWVYGRGRSATRAFLQLGKLLGRRWARPIESLRRELGLPTGAHPLFEGQLSGEHVIALFSPLFGAPQPDHPPNTSIVGFAFYDSEAGGAATLSPEVQTFLSAGPAPIVFTQGTSAVQDAEDFIRESLAAVRRLGARAIFVLDAERAREWASHASASILISSYAPYSLLFLRARVNVHHGGVGTTAQALRAGRPQLISPYLVDQPDNAARVERLGAGRVLEQGRYRAKEVAREITRLDDPVYGSRAREVGEIVAREDGAHAAAGIISGVLSRAPARSGS